MSRYFHGLAWFGLYVLLVVLPAAVAVLIDPFESPRPSAVEISVALGLLAYPLVMVQFALVSHLQASSRPFGTDALVQFHQYVGFLCVFFVVAHPVLLNLQGLPWPVWNPLGGTPATRTGVIATLAILVIAGTTVFRKRLGLSYEWWQRLHYAFAMAAAVALPVHAVAVDGYTRAAPMRYLLVLYAGVFGATALYYRLLRPLGLQRRPWEVIGNRDEGADTRTVVVRPAGHDGFSFEPGQFAYLITGSSPWSSQQHPLSIASSAERAAGSAIEFAIKAVGDWSRDVVPRLAPGTRVWVEGPFGAFTTERKAGQGFVLIAGGSGIAPFRSMLLTMRDRGDRRHVLLFYATHDETRMILRSELEALRGLLNLDVVYVFEEPRSEAAGERGRITADLLRRYLPPQYRRYTYFVCGPPAMMDAVESMLIDARIRSGSIDTERFTVV